MGGKAISITGELCPLGPGVSWEIQCKSGAL